MRPAWVDNKDTCEVNLEAVCPCVQVAVCTPGRMIDLLKMKACSMLRATYLVFDEADRMFDMGFEPQVRFDSAVPHWKLLLHVGVGTASAAVACLCMMIMIVHIILRGGEQPTPAAGTLGLVQLESIWGHHWLCLTVQYLHL